MVPSDMVKSKKETKKSLWSSVLKPLLAWTKASRWRKASKCKSLVKKVQLRLSIQKTRREVIIRQSRADIAQLLQSGRLSEALARVEQLYNDQCLLSAYHQINQYCECMVTNHYLIIKHRSAQSLPVDVGQAISSLVFAASRYSGLPELNMLRNLFRELYGFKLDSDNVDLLPGNLVNSQLKENLCIQSVPEDAKLTIINEIAEEHTLFLEFPGSQKSCEQQSHQKAEVLDSDVQDSCSHGRNGCKASSTKTSFDGGVPIHETCIANTDDLEVKSLTAGPSNRIVESCNRSESSFCDNKTSHPKSRNFSTGVPLRHNEPVKECHSFDSSIDKWEAQNGSSSCSSHVHPKLPNYEEVVAKFSDLRTQAL